MLWSAVLRLPIWGLAPVNQGHTHSSEPKSGAIFLCQECEICSTTRQPAARQRGTWQKMWINNCRAAKLTPDGELLPLLRAHHQSLCLSTEHSSNWEMRFPTERQGSKSLCCRGSCSICFLTIQFLLALPQHGRWLQSPTKITEADQAQCLNKDRYV